MDIYENQAPVTPEETPIQPEPTPSVQPEMPQPPKKHTGKRIVVTLVAILSAAAIAAGSTAVFFLTRLTAQEKRTEQTLRQLSQQIAALEEELNSKSFTGNGNSISGTDNASPEGMTPGQLYAKTVSSVVAITNEKRVPTGSTVSTGISYGTGFILSANGYIVTNHHVIEGATTLTVTTHDGVNYTAMVRGYDATHDLAVLKIEAAGLPAVTIGSSSDLIVGDQVAVIGNPLGDLNSTLTVGYISGKDRVISTDGSLINMLQTDASVNPGNSGGPIFNMNGELVGIITAKYSGITASGATIEGIGFAIPVDDVLKKINDLVQYGYVTGGYLGVLCHDMDRTAAEYYGLPYGVYVSNATDGFCAKAAGVQAKDIIIALGDTQITSMNDLTRALQEYKGGEKTTITVWRSGLEVVLDITLDAKPQQ